MTRRTKTPFEIMTASLGQLTKAELENLAAMVTALIELEDADEDDQVADSTRAGTSIGIKGGKAKGHVETKLINGCGPYLYLRYWQGGKLKSKYIGKAKKEGG